MTKKHTHNIEIIKKKTLIQSDRLTGASKNFFLLLQKLMGKWEFYFG